MIDKEEAEKVRAHLQDARQNLDAAQDCEVEGLAEEFEVAAKHDLKQAGFDLIDAVLNPED